MYFEPHWSNLIQFDQVWTHLIQFEQAWFSLNKFDLVWTSLIQFEQVWSISIKFKPIRSILNKFDLVWTSLIQFEQVWSSLKEYVGPIKVFPCPGPPSKNKNKQVMILRHKSCHLFLWQTNRTCLIGSLCPERKSDVSSVIFRAFIGGSVASFLTACIAGALLKE
jgi:hypothetical protein